ncbi:MAG: bifunctional phosphoribosylaminoimidazolecarboxamide formyltransferase/IMP cyclohydrolase [Bacteroidales bacterium]|jgi:phosphoribosylaminoimidazolecarboxamide formyltransferase/IMP cyclohydrolase|nr:bifunctional phosphoribosylaminoimidazolecarboxamide formyltransferase/IMP cyclohydrolase [Bacteroidales bacterium]MCI2121083.1 bifunctional phosphoribosylaminoimidazolecarboxamide formyltransferase/IMP cyclohydrolase [Bacteroidales bacterium]MCI2144898.1 bifunctional phosphoribosylaminoimidazolecarboxamide formyltransferase/IMP cyclohydrolase [Bacteroidales bacterium]
MTDTKYTRKINTALISVFDKEGIDEIASILSTNGVKILSTGGTYGYLVEKGFECEKVEDITSYPSILGGRVKTLHPKIFGGILARRDNQKDEDERKEYGIPCIDLVIVDLYPFEATVASGAPEQDIIEKIDIGGISLIRAAAKNYRDVLTVSGKEQYAAVKELLKAGQCETSLEERRRYAAEAFLKSSHYDTEIFSWFNGSYDIPSFSKSIVMHSPLRYGENPHQKALFFGDPASLPKQLHGKEISYNNMVDIEAALELISDFDNDGGKNVTVGVIKHNNACGCATRGNLVDAWKDALSGDPVSAYGSIIVTNTKITAEAAEEIGKIFFEVIIAKGYDDEALELLEHKKNRIILMDNGTKLSCKKFRSMFEGVLVQDRDTCVETPGDLRPVTVTKPTEAQIADMLFANKIVKHSKSNAITLAKNGMLLASGIGQTSRVDALKQAIEKARSFGQDLEGAVMASDAFFPFSDCVEVADKAGIKAVIQPGGSIRDQESIDYCNTHGMAMVMTGKRHFKH